MRIATIELRISAKCEWAETIKSALNEKLIKEKAVMRKLVTTGAPLERIRKQRSKIKELELRCRT